MKKPVELLRKARIADVKDIQTLIHSFAQADLMLPRSLNELFDHLRDYWVCERAGKIIGCCALHVCWQDLAEIKSLAVERRLQCKGIGTRLVEACMNEAKTMGAKRVFVLTYQPDFFKRFGFRRVTHASLPHKVWAECINCPKFPDCREIALLKTL